MDIIASLQLGDSNVVTLTPEQYQAIQEYQEGYNKALLAPDKPIEEKWLWETAHAFADAHGMLVDFVDNRYGACSVSRTVMFRELLAWAEQAQTADVTALAKELRAAASDCYYALIERCDPLKITPVTAMVNRLDKILRATEFLKE